MNLPFSPTFFRKIDVFQQLMEYESHRNEKHLWDGVKAVLIWAASTEHQHLGSYIDSGHVKDALKYCVDAGFFPEEERKRLVYSCEHIAESLPVYMFGDFEQEKKDNKYQRVRINRNGILAGRILFETDFLRKNLWQYNRWTYLWWVILALAGVLLVTQAYDGVKKVFSQPDTLQYHEQYRQKPSFHRGWR